MDTIQSKNQRLQPVNLLGLPFHPVTLTEAANMVEAAIEQQQHCFISTPNLNFTVMAAADQEFYQSVLESDLVLADGMPLVWVARFLRLPITERVAGSDLFDCLSKRPRETKFKVFFFGGEPGIAEKASTTLTATSPGFEGCGFYDPGFVTVEQMSKPEIIQYINDCKPDFIVVALGAKKGQQWIMRNKATLEAPVISHLGAVVNFVAGHIVRAPENWQKYGLEWVWRIRQEPKLYKRYVFDGVGFLRMLLTQVLPLRLIKSRLKAKTLEVGSASITSQHNSCLLQMSGSFTQADLDEFESKCQNILERDGDVILIDRGVQYMDEFFVARLSQLQMQLMMQNRVLYLQQISLALKYVLKSSGVLKHFKIL